MNTEQLYDIYLQHPVICTDTRKISPGCIFFALKGDNFDANAFAQQALEAGAAYAVIDNPLYHVNERCILTGNVLETLQALAAHHRSRLSIPFIGITGTNGKTTTKELVNAVLSQRYKTYATQGNLNNHIGVPLTLLAIGPDIEMAIIEMGANHQKEIEFLCSIARPTHGLITNVGKAHLEGFGGFEGVKIAKGELYTFLARNNGTALINHDNPELMTMSRLAGLQRVVYYGTGTDNFVQGNLQSADPYLVADWTISGSAEQHRAHANLTGTYNLENILAAICLGSLFELRADEINKGIAAYVPTNNRSQIVKTAHNTLICDYYNANPSSMEVALENFKTVNAGNKVLILGDMFELGDESAAEHLAILEKAGRLNAAQRLFIGQEFYKLKDKSSDSFYRSTAEAYEALKAHTPENATILIKGSRGMKLESLVELL